MESNALLCIAVSCSMLQVWHAGLFSLHKPSYNTVQLLKLLYSIETKEDRILVYCPSTFSIVSNNFVLSSDFTSSNNNQLAQFNLMSYSFLSLHLKYFRSMLTGNYSIYYCLDVKAEITLLNRGILSVIPSFTMSRYQLILISTHSLKLTLAKSISDS